MKRFVIFACLVALAVCDKVVLGTVAFMMVVCLVGGLGAGLWAAFINPRAGGYTGGMSAEKRREFMEQQRHEDLLRVISYSNRN